MNSLFITEIEDVLWTVTDRCNLNCIYCSVNGENSILSNPELDLHMIDKIITQLDKLTNLKSVILSGGEFLISNHYDYILENVSRPGRDIFIITNGTYMNTRIIENLTKFRPKVMVSLDSTQEEINSITRGKGKLKLTISNIQQYLDVGLEVVLIAVITKHNVYSIIDDLLVLRKFGIRNVLLQQLHAEGKGNRLFHVLSPQPSDIKLLYKRLIEFEKHFPDMALDYNEICFFPMHATQYNKKCKAEMKYKPQRIFMCGAGIKFLVIKGDGTLIPCNAMHKYEFGNILKEDIIEIFERSPNLIKIRNWREYRVDKISGCEKCPYMPICDGGCRADVLNLGGNLLDIHPYCDVMENSEVKCFEEDSLKNA